MSFFEQFTIINCSTPLWTNENHLCVDYNVRRIHLEQAEKVTPGSKAPTLSPLEDPNWVSVGAMVPNKDVADVMDKLQEIGASDLFIIAIENCRK